eukprot:gene17232-22758_t
MKSFAILLSTLAVVCALPSIIEVDYKTPAIRKEIIEAVNNAKTTWKAAVPIKFANATVAQVKQTLGTILPDEPEYIAPAVVKTEFKYADSDIPESFDVRTAWPECAAITGHVRDQSNCGSCWAFGSTESFNDRYCITTKDSETLFSAEDTAACCTGLTCSFSAGCNGGQPSGAWNWFVKKGVSTGGDYADIGSGSTCKPYSLQSCAHHVAPPDGMVACDSISEYNTPTCSSSCTESAYKVAYSNDKHFASSSYSLKTVKNIQKDLMESGSISVTLSVYEDFESYSSGVYQHVTGSYLGGHAIKLIGWGVDNGVEYWTCVNSWNDSWGEAGTFRILRGSNECGIESGAVAGDV